MKKSWDDRIAAMHSGTAKWSRDQAAKRAKAGSITTGEVLDAVEETVRETLGPSAPLPVALTTLRKRELVEQLSRQGLTVSEIAAATGIKYGSVAKYRHELGINPRKPRI